MGHWGEQWDVRKGEDLRRQAQDAAEAVDEGFENQRELEAAVDLLFRFDARFNHRKQPIHGRQPPALWTAGWGD